MDLNWDWTGAVREKLGRKDWRLDSIVGWSWILGSVKKHTHAPGQAGTDSPPARPSFDK